VPADATYLETLNPEQRQAVEHGVGSSAPGPLLVIAGAYIIVFWTISLAGVTGGRLAAVVVVALGVTLGVRGAAPALGDSSTPRLRTSPSGA
jgi:predicted phage tail protein